MGNRRDFGFGVCALAAAWGVTACLGSVPDLLKGDASSNGDSSALEAGPPDATMGDEAASDDAGPLPEAAPDANGVEGGPAACIDGGNCTSGPCQLGVATCGADASSCATTDTLKDGASCDGGADASSSVCKSGACVACDQGADCSDPNSCTKKTIDCSTGSPVCTAGGNVRDGTMCGSGMFCAAGKCTACSDGSSCPPPASPCDQGTLSCSTGTCVDQQKPAADGTTCGSNEVCHGGQCVGCVAGGPCTPTTICHTGLYSCATGVQTCVDNGAGQNNVACDDGNGCTQTDTCQGGACTGANPVSCAASDACHAAGTCTSTGSAAHTCSNPTGNNGATCGTSPNMTCSGGTCGCASGYTMCGSTCVTFGTDASNCGQCGHSCGGGQCAGGKCQPVALGNFDATPGGTGSFSAIAADASYVYAILNTTSDGKIERCSVSGCTTGAQIVAQNQPTFLNSIFVNAAGVFWTSASAATGAVGACLPGNCPITYATYTNENPAGIVSDGQTVFWALDGSGGGVDAILSCPVGGCSGAPTAVVTGTAVQIPEDVVLSGNSLFFAQGNNIQQAPKSGGTATPITPAPAFEEGWGSPAADATDVAFTNFAGQTDTTSIFACPVTGCPSGGPIPIASPAGTPCIDSSGIYWSTGTAIQTCAASGCANTPTTLASGIMSNPAEVATNATAIFWVNGTTIWKLAK